MRVLHVTMTGTAAGAGVRRHIESLVPLEVRFGIEALVVAIQESGEMGGRLRSQSIPVFELCSTTGLNVTLLIRFWQFLNKVRPNIVHFHTLRLIPLLVAGLRCFPAVLTFHVVPEARVFGRFRITEFFTARFLRGAIAISSSVRERIQGYGYYPRTIWETISNGVDRDAFFPAERPPTWGRESPFLVSIMARFDPVKRVSDALEAVARVHRHGANVRLWVIGTGQLSEALRQEAKRLEISEVVQFWGHQEQPSQLLRQSHLFLMLSEYESFGLAPLEAASCGVPVLSYPRCGGVEDWLWTGHGGIICKERTPDSAADEILDLMSETTRWERLRQSAISVASEFSAERCAQSTVSFYKTILAKKSRI